MIKLDETVLQDITSRLVTGMHPEKVILFGSYAWGTPTENSDVDLYVIVQKSDLSPARRSVQAHRCLQGLGIAKDILVRTQAEADKYRYVHASLECQIFEKGRVLYERG